MFKDIKKVIAYVKQHTILIFILAVGWLVNLSFFLPIKRGMGHDLYWHLALIETAFKKIPFQMPVFSGANLQGYNYLLDLIMFGITKLGISSFYVYFIVVPVIYVLLTSYLTILFGIKFNKSIFFVAPLVFFIFLASPFSYLLSFYKRGNLFYGFNYPTAMQSCSALTNLSYAFTVPIILTTLLIFLKRKISYWDRLFLGFLIVLAFGFKFYGGTILFFMIIVYELLLFFKSKKIFQAVIAFFIYSILVFLAVIVFYNPFSSTKTGGIFAFYPFAIVNNLIEDPDGLYIPQLVMSRYSLLAANKFSVRLMLIELITLIIYLVYNFGTRIISWFYLIIQAVKKKLSCFEVTILMTIIFSIVLTTVFIQKGGDWWNTVQFFGYGLFLANIFAAAAIYQLSKIKKSLFGVLILIIVVLTMPLNIELLVKTYTRIRYSTEKEINLLEKQALTFLKNRRDNGPIFALPVFSKLAYVPAWSAKPVYFADENVISNLGIDYQLRKKQLENLKELNIDQLPVKYFYLLKKDKDYEILLEKMRNSRKIKRIFDNEEVIVFEKD